MNSRSIQDSFDIFIEPEVIAEARRDTAKGITSHVRISQNLFELKISDVHATMSLKPGDGIDSFRCNCGYSGKGPCKHFLFLFYAASDAVAKLEQQSAARAPISTLECKVARSKSITPELKAVFKKFKKQYNNSRQVYLESKNKREANRNLMDLYQVRNEAMKECFNIAYEGRTKESYFGSFEIIIYTLFNFCKIIGYDDEDMLMAVEHHVGNQLGVLYRKSKAAEKRKMWEYIAKSLSQPNTDKIPENPARKIIMEFLLENYDGDKYYNDNLSLLEDLIENALVDDNNNLAEDWALEYLWLLGDSDIPEDELFQKYHVWWDVPAIRLNYLEHCMETYNYLTAYTIAVESLAEPSFSDEDEAASLHRILLGASFKTNKFEKAVEEAKILAKTDPETLLWESRQFLMPDKKRWNKMKDKLVPILKKLRPGMVW